MQGVEVGGLGVREREGEDCLAFLGATGQVSSVVGASPGGGALSPTEGLQDGHTAHARHFAFPLPSLLP